MIPIMKKSDKKELLLSVVVALLLGIVGTLFYLDLTFTKNNTGGRVQIDPRTSALTGSSNNSSLEVTSFHKSDGTPNFLGEAEQNLVVATAATGSSGSRFSGAKIRTFQGARHIDREDLLKASSSDLFPSFPVKQCDMWSVVTTIHEPDESIKGVGKLKNWCLVIVGDTITNDDIYQELVREHENIYYLSAQYQKQNLSNPKENTSFGPFASRIPFKSFARKNIGYLFAIAQGAQVIYDFDDDNVLTTFEDGIRTSIPFIYDEHTYTDKSITFMMSDEVDSARTKFKASLAFNPYLYMGPSYNRSWPRGFPLDNLEESFEQFKEKPTPSSFGDLPYSAVGVIQSLCNGDPDVDAIFRLARNEKGNSFTFDQSRSAKNLLIPFDKYSPYNAQATTHMKGAFWGMFLPITVPGRVTDIWRSYFTQRIMKDIGLHLIYTPPIVSHERTSHDYLADFGAENDLYLKTSKLLEHLEKWTSSKEHLADRIMDLWISLYEHSYIELDDVETMRQWLRVLLMIGYEFPQAKVTMEVPHSQPVIEGHTYRARPYFNVNLKGLGVPFNRYECKPDTNDDSCLREWASTLDWEKRPRSAIVKIILMTMDEWPLLQDWVLYHGEIFGFHNLYIIDSSTNPLCISFLRYARDNLGANVIYSTANLNELQEVMTNLGSSLSGSADFIFKVDTDEFMTVVNEEKNDWTSMNSYLDSYAVNPDHPLRNGSLKRFGFKQGSIPDEQICLKDPYSTIDNFPLHNIGPAPEYFKRVFDARTVGNGSGKVEINLGGHAFNIETEPTRFGLIHYHFRCIEIEAENCKRVLERHDFISPSDTDVEVKTKLMNILGWNETKEDLCDLQQPVNNGVVSVHKAVFYVKWLHCPDKMRKAYYPAKGDNVIAGSQIIKSTLKNAYQKYG